MGEAEKQMELNNDQKEESPAGKKVRLIIGVIFALLILFVIFRAVQVKFFGG